MEEKLREWLENKVIFIEDLLREGDELGYTLTFDEYVVDFYNSDYYKEEV